MTDPTKIKNNDLMAFVNYVKIKAVDNNGLDLLASELGNPNSSVRFRGRELIESAFSADQYEKEVKVSLTKVAQIFIKSINVPFTVCFIKKDETQRVLRGRYVSHERLFGRSRVEDFDLDANAKGDKIRQVDHRSLVYLIVDNVKYTVK